LKDPESFVSRLKGVLSARKKYHVAEAELVAVPEVGNPAACLLVLKLPEADALAVTALNFGRSALEEDLDLSQIPGLSVARFRGQKAVDAVAGETDGEVPESGRLKIKLSALGSKTLVIGRASP
jgi:hypothetical protein